MQYPRSRIFQGSSAGGGMPKRRKMTAHRAHGPCRFIGLASRRGLTLAECLVALTILPLAVVGVAFSVTAGQQQSFEALRQERAATLAEALMEEILAKPYADPQGTTTTGPD